MVFELGFSSSIASVVLLARNWKNRKVSCPYVARRFNLRWFRGRVVCALNYEAGDPGSIPVSGGTTDWLFSVG